MKFYKITNKKECHYGFQYNDGLNVLIGEFNSDTNKECVEGGLYFTDSYHLHNFYEYGCYLREIMLPTNDKNFKMVKLSGKYRANMIILGNKYDLFDINNLNTVLNINNNLDELVRVAIKNNKLEFVKHVVSKHKDNLMMTIQYHIVSGKDIEFKFEPTLEIALCACEYKNSEFLKKYCKDIYLDSQNISTLIGTMQMEIMYDENLLKIIDIFLESGVLFDPPENLLKFACHTRNHKILSYCVSVNNKYNCIAHIKEIIDLQKINLRHNNQNNEETTIFVRTFLSKHETLTNFPKYYTISHPSFDYDEDAKSNSESSVVTYVRGKTNYYEIKLTEQKRTDEMKEYLENNASTQNKNNISLIQNKCCLIC